jgi:RNA polymerase sigma-70 factor (ECF subfamily)
MVTGDETAYRTFHETYYPRLTRYLLVVTSGDEDAAREALQGTLVRVVRHIKVFDDETRFWNWLTVLARTAFADQRRKRSRYVALLGRFTEHTRTEATGTDSGEADSRLLAALETGVRGLPAEERELVEQKYYAGESVRNLAESLRTSEKAVESRLGRVRRKLKQALLAALKHEQAD